MTWTYDPLIARNAYFNLAKLGAGPVAYFPDHYGSLADGLNGGDPSDRLLASWDLTLPPGPRAPAPDPAVAHVALDNADDRPGPWHPPDGGHDGPVLVGVPRDIERLRREDPALASSWRQSVRVALSTLLTGGWRVVGFDRDAHYVLAPPGPEVPR
jgi:predicted GNAT superfamily acetyltransferase